MRLLPQDLGTKWHIMTVRNRALGVASVWKKSTDPRLGILGKMWIKNVPVSEEVAATTMPLTENVNKGFVGGGIAASSVFGVILLCCLIGGPERQPLGEYLTMLSVITGIGAGLGYTMMVALPHRHIKKLHATPVHEEDLTPFLTGNVPGLPEVFGEVAGKFLRFLGRQMGNQAQGVQDDLERNFLFLVRDVVRLQTVPKEAEDDLRAAIRAIGEALCRLPDPELTYSTASGNAADQLGEAQMLYARADRERDPVVAGSLRRQAEALEHAAHASDNAAVVARRVRALRDELRSQIDVLRLTLPNWGRPGYNQASAQAAHSEQSLSHIAQSVQNVAREAAAVSDAQDELDDFMSGRSTKKPATYTVQTETEQVQTIRLR